MDFHTRFWYILVIIVYVQKPTLNAHVDVSSGTRDLIFGFSLSLHSYFLYTRYQTLSFHAYMYILSWMFCDEFLSSTYEKH